MTKRLHCIVISLAFLLSLARGASAEPPGNLSIGVERLFGLSRVSAESEFAGFTSESTTTSFSFLGTPLGSFAYSSPRLAVDYLSASGFSFGGGLAYQTVSLEGDGGGDVSVDALLLAPRAGYYLQSSPEFGLWPRVGITYRAAGEDLDQTIAALTAELSLLYLVARGRVGLSAMPHLDFGIGGSSGDGDDSIDQTATEFGVQFGMSLFL